MTPHGSAPPHGIDELESWVDEYGDYLYRFALARIHSPESAEDLVQETFLAALKSRDRFEGRSSAKTWLTSILKHKIIDLIRKDMRERPVEDLESIPEAIDALFDARGEWTTAPQRWDVNPQNVYERKEFMQQLAVCLRKLPKRMARAFTMREMDGLSTKEICEVLNISEANSWVILYRARMALRRCLELSWGGPSH